MEMKTIDVYRLLVGSNNETKKIEVSKAIQVLNKFDVKGFNVRKSLGYWDNEKENSFVIEILNTKEIGLSDSKVFEIKKQLEEYLKQFVVLVYKEKVEVLSDG